MPAVAEQRILEWKPSFSRKQSDAWWLLQDPNVDELCYGGAKGGGKSWFGVHWMYLECFEIARKFVPYPLKAPIPVGFMGRKVGKHFKETTLDTWKRFIPPERYSIKGDPAEISIFDRVKIRTGGLEAKEELEKFNSAEFARVFVDQAEETTRDDVSVLRGAMRLSIGGEEIPSKILWTANPGQCWLKEEFIDNPQPNKPFVQALPTDNTKMPGLDRYIVKLKDAFKHRPELLAAYLHGDWTGFEGGDQLILLRWIENAYDNVQYTGIDERLISVDPARFGDDETVIFLMDGTDVSDEKIMGKSRTTDISRYITTMSRRNGHCACVVDTIGIGAGVADELSDLGVKVIPFNSSEKAEDYEHYYNLRAEAWSKAADDFAEGKIRLTYRNPELRNQLTIPRYYYRNGRVLVEGKDEIKKRLSGKSPGHADAYIMGLWGRRQAEMANTISIGRWRELKAEYGY